MSNIVPTNVQVPAHLANKVGQPSALAQSLSGGISGLGGEAFPRISIKGSRFRIVEDGTETVLDSTKLAVVIVGANPKLSKTYYASQWDKDAEPTAPDCYSLDGVKPHPEAEQPQSDMCAGCQWNAWGSKVTPTGQQVKACADKKRLAVVSADDPTGPTYLLEVTPAALKGLNAYQKELSTRGIPPEIVKTMVSFDTDASFPKLKFGFGGFIDEETQTALEDVFGSDQVKAITGEAQPEAAAPKPKAEKPKPVLVKEAEPEAAPVEEEAPKRGFGAAKKEAKKVEPKVAPEEPKAAPVADDAVGDLANDIESLLGDLADDD